MRVLGIDFGERRIGLAISDPTCTLATPLTTVHVTGSRKEAVDRLAGLIEELRSGEGGLGAIVVGLPKRLDGSATEQTAPAERFVRRLAARTRVPIVMQDERLTSHEADARLSARYRDWRERKAKLDAAAAAVLLQEYLDGHREQAAPETDGAGDGRGEDGEEERD